jgi:Glycosyltransferase
MQPTKQYILRMMTRKAINISVSEYLCQELVEHGFNVHKVKHIGLSRRIESSAKKKIKLNQSSILKVISLSRINPQKVPNQAIKYLDALAYQLGCKIEYALYGSGDHVFVSELLNIGKCTSRVEVKYKGFITGDEVYSVISASDLVFNPSILPEACPTVSLEAAMMKRPYIYNGKNGNGELARYHSELSYEINIFDTDSSCALASAIKSYLSTNVTCISEKLPCTENFADQIREIIFN